MSDARKGSGNNMYSKHHSEETKTKISLKNKGRKVSETGRKRMSEGHKGKHLSEETKQKLRESYKRRHENHSL